jgi:hypothetical protein
MLRECLPRLTAIGIGLEDAKSLRRISMTLHRWHELECGTAQGCIERDDTTKRPIFRYGYCSGGSFVVPIADREAGAKARLANIMARYPDLTAYIQGDPRGSALFILKPGDVPEGADVGACYSRGVAVYK